MQKSTLITATLITVLLFLNAGYVKADIQSAESHVQETALQLNGLLMADVDYIVTVGDEKLCDFETIQDAIDSGADVVRVVDKGSPYYENLEIINLSTVLDGSFNNCEDAEAGIGGEFQAVIDGSQNGRVFFIDNAMESLQKVSLNHLVVQNGMVNDFGGGVRIQDNLFVHMNDLVVKGNTAYNYFSGGGGVALTHNVGIYKPMVYIENSVIENNNAHRGGGIFSFGDLLVSGNTKIINNHSYTGGGLYSGMKTTLFSPVVISGNFATSNGAGVTNSGSWHSELNIVGLQICEQAYCFGKNSQSVSIQLNTTDSSNPSKGWGGGLANFSGNQVYIENATFRDNKAVKGGAISSGYESNLVTIRNSKFLANEAIYGGSFFSFPGSSFNVISSLIKANQADIGLVAAIQAYKFQFNKTNHFKVSDSLIVNNGNNGKEYMDGFLIYADNDKDSDSNINVKIDLNYSTIVGNKSVGDALIYNTGSGVVTNIVGSIVDEFKPLYYGHNGAYMQGKCLMLSHLGGIVLPPPQDIVIDDPQFVDKKNENYLLKENSKAIDFCDQESMSLTDMNGENRGIDSLNDNKFGVFDLGAFEYVDKDDSH